MSEHLGKITFLDTPDVNGSNVLTQADLQGTTNQIVNAGGALSLAPNLIMPGTEGFVPPVGTTAQRPVAAILGEQRFSSTLGLAENYNGSFWLPTGKVIQSATGTIASGFSGSVAAKLTTAGAPIAGDRGLNIWSAAFTPLVTGSSIVIQYSIMASHSNATARSFFTSVWVGAACIGVQAAGGSVVTAVAATGVGGVNLIVQQIYTTTSTAALNIAGYLGHVAAAATAATIYVNSINATGTFGGLTATQYRILEII